MKKIALNIHESKYELEKASSTENYIIPQKEQDLILERRKNSNPATQKDWEVIKNSFKFD